MTTNSEEVKKLVRERYGAKARGVIELSEALAADSSGEACCEPGCCGGSQGEAATVAEKPTGKSNNEAAGIIKLLDVSQASGGGPGRRRPASRRCGEAPASADILESGAGVSDPGGRLDPENPGQSVGPVTRSRVRLQTHRRARSHDLLPRPARNCSQCALAPPAPGQLAFSTIPEHVLNI